MVHKLGYGNWDELKAAFRTSALFRFDWFVKSRTTQELARRCDTLIRLVEKENQEHDERERQARKEKKLAKVLFMILTIQPYPPKSHAFACRVIIYCPFSYTSCWVCMIYVFGSSLIIYAKTIYDYHIQQSMTPSKRSMGRQTDSPPSLKKRKQLSMDDYPNMASFNPPSILFFFFFLLRGAVWIKLYLILFCREKGRSDLSLL